MKASAQYVRQWITASLIGCIALALGLSTPGLFMKDTGSDYFRFSWSAVLEQALCVLAITVVGGYLCGKLDISKPATLVCFLNPLTLIFGYVIFRLFPWFGAIPGPAQLPYFPTILLAVAIGADIGWRFSKHGRARGRYRDAPGGG